MERKNAIYRIKNERGEYNEIMLKTTAEQVFFEDGINLQEKLDNGDLGGSGGEQSVRKIDWNKDMINNPMIKKGTGENSYVCGEGTVAAGIASSSVGANTVANVNYSHAQGYYGKALGIASHVEGYRLTENRQIAYGRGSHVEGIDCVAGASFYSLETLTAAHAEGFGTTAGANFAHSEGYNTSAIGEGSHAEGYRLNKDRQIAYGRGSHVEGIDCIAGGSQYSAESYVGAHAEGHSTIAQGYYSHAEGYCTRANGKSSHASGSYTIAEGDSQTVIGTCNNTSHNDLFIIGNGSSEYNRSNAFRVTKEGFTYAKGAYSSTGADYAEMFEWADSNHNQEDRIGFFVTFEKGTQKIRKANSLDTYILGVVSVNTAVLGDNFDEEWKDKYIRDKWGRIVYEDVIIPAETITINNPNGLKEEVIIQPERIQKQPVLNPDYQQNENYIPREKRPEWSPIGLLGKLLVYDDGTCEVGEYCKPNNDGIATKSEDGYYVMERIDRNIIKIMFK